MTKASIPLLKKLHTQVPQIISISLQLRENSGCRGAKIPHYCVGFSTYDAGVLVAAKDRIEKRWEGIPVTICQGQQKKVAKDAL